jgi:hypothetical protein
MEDDARAVAKMLKNSISTLTKEREDRKHLEREVDGTAGMLIPYVRTRHMSFWNKSGSCGQSYQCTATA